MEIRKFENPHEVRTFEHGKLELVKLGGATVGRARLEPGWRWSKDVQPIAKTASCQSAHLAYQVSGVMRVKMDDGTEHEVRPGEAYMIPPGHDAWVVGDEPVVTIDFQGMADYARQRSKE
jgi:hypothetical protein